MQFERQLSRLRTALIVLLPTLTCACHLSAANTNAPIAAPATKNAAATAKLFHATQAGDLSSLRAAIANGADVNGRDTNGLPPLLALLHPATKPLTDGQRECVSCLLQNGADVDSRDELRRTPLIHAARIGDLPTIEVLVEGEAYVKTRDGLHKTALFYAVESNRPDLVRYLASHGDLVSLTIKERKQLGKQ